MTEKFILVADQMNSRFLNTLEKAIRGSALNEGVVVCVPSALDDALKHNISAGLVVVTPNMDRAIEFYGKGATRVVPMVADVATLAQLLSS